MRKRGTWLVGGGIVSALIVVMLVFGLAFGQMKATDDYHKELSAKGKDEFTVETVNGSVDIRGNDGDKIIIDAEIVVTGLLQDVCEDLIKKIKVEIEEDEDETRVKTKTPRKDGYNSQVNFKIKLPKSLRVVTETMNGSIFVVDVDEGVELETTNGAITCENIRGEVEVSTVNGGVELSDIAGNVEASTINGGINCEVTTGTPEMIELGAVNGSINLLITDQLDASVEASTVNGRIRVSGTAVGRFDKYHKNYTAVFGDGKGAIELGTVNGSVSIDVKVPD